jgi:large subunit ribosomal protein L25
MATTQAFELAAAVRQGHGKALVRRLRNIGLVPGVIYGADKDPVSLEFNHNELIRKLDNEAFYSHILSVRIDDAEEKAILRAIQRHPYKPRIMHIDLQRISATQKLTMSIPLHFVGEDKAPGVVTSGGLVSHLETSVEISCLPADLPEYLEVDLSQLEIEQPVHLSDITLPKGVELVELLHDNDLPIANIHLPRVVEEEPAAPETPPEPEVITAKAGKEEGAPTAPEEPEQKG